MGWRRAQEGEGQRYEDESGLRWLTQLTIPSEQGLAAFKVVTGAVEYLGPVVETADGEGAWSVADVQADDHADPSDDLYAVQGWLVVTPLISCPAPDDYGPDTDTTYWCGGSFITQN